ncbi:family 2 glycosyl transferase [Amycolatopsis thailandensis]|uniref:Family 2 glycosyl transferase n=1 Tax=Amycolatopsis thailandensis TaxID=589330 RepID=A0A229SF64_9PSEU|nr:glycosyltransferase family 2 protein [Amycolatopsis thailandensis]OXM57568.1 family 2 glycosyl transferase [Amycolatopsis thailandensis]
MITSVGVLIPARDEATHLPNCLSALREALRELPPGIERRVCVVADRCRDDTAELAAKAGAQVCVNTHDLTIGAVRALGARHLLSGLNHHAATRTLLLSTDADTVVERDWAVRHVRRAEAGWDAVAGTAQLDSRLVAAAQPHYEALLAQARNPAGHGNVYGANLSVRASAYRTVGGFLPIRTAEDHDLWHRLFRAGFRVAYADEAKVTTSARLDGRAPEGLSARLRTLGGRGHTGNPNGTIARRYRAARTPRPGDGR